MAGWIETHEKLRGSLRALGEAIPATMSEFARLEAATVRDGALSARAKSLIALAVGIAARCDGCVAHYVHKALRAGATREEIGEAIGVAILMGGGPAVVYGAHALEALGEFTASTAPSGD